MTDVYSTVLASGIITDTDPPVDTPCPAGFVMVVRDIDITTNTGIFVNEFVVYDTTLGNTIWLAVASPPPLLQWFGFRGRQVFPVGTGFSLQSTQGTWGYRVSGYLLTAP